MDQSSSSSSSQSLAIESFSNSWLTSINTSFFDSLESSSSLRPSLDMSMFNFDIPSSSSQAALASADQLFVNGLIKPTEQLTNYPSPPSSPQPPDPPLASSSSSATAATSKRGDIVASVVDVQCRVFCRWRKMSTRVVMKCFRRMWVRSSRKSIRVDDVGRRVLEVRSLSNSPPQVSPRRLSAGYSTDGNWSDVDSSIYEAVLHCKRSIGK
ncbi:hypothetical protein LINPERHAP2_LOCUS21476 [Linum perenne]